ncbi:Predicted arabinose efflux permease, MFS family [Terriglobus roseus]|uniref:Predicted arabinose efflux permease, MFS family n=1 Tax=Terriglobus roseus TaxID=392734 RepID=A0A1G7KTK8_9BACT|nr:Predicted arabinose efflux permease, MFS family [Terriglobus roseus]
MRSRNQAIVQTPRTVLRLFAIAAGLSVANIYCAQPILDSVARSFGFNEASAGSIITVTQAGYALGLIFIVPLGDLMNRRNLIVRQLFLSAIALAVIGLAHTKELLLSGLFFVGLLAVVVQVLVAFSATLVPPEKRGSAIGTVTSGVVLGILLARTVAGVLSDLGSWRCVYLTSAVLMLCLAYALHKTLPDVPGETRNSYPQLLVSTVGLLRDTPVLRIRAAIAFFLFAAFSTLWTSMVLPLTTALHPMSHTAIGSIGLAGAAGAIAAGRAGRWADAGHGQRTTGIALGLLIIAWACIASLPRTFLLFLLGVILLDFAVQAVHVTNQSLIFTVRPEAKSRLVAVYMLFYSLGSGTGAWASTKAYAAYQWNGVSLVGAFFSVTALVIWAISRCRFEGISNKNRTGNPEPPQSSPTPVST